MGAVGGGGNNIYWRQMDTGRVPDGRARASPRTDGGSRSMLLTDAIMKTYFCRCRSRLRDPLPSGVVR